MKLRAVLIVAALLSPSACPADAVDRVLKALDPEERAHQACIIKGIEAVRHDKLLVAADRMKTSIFGRAEFRNGTEVHAAGGAVRANSHWYKLRFDCTVTADQMRATAFTYRLGSEIPKADWDQLGLWQ